MNVFERYIIFLKDFNIALDQHIGVSPLLPRKEVENRATTSTILKNWCT